MTAAVITGAGQGIGRATAEEMARRGLAVALLARNEGPLHETATLCRALGVEALVVPCDVAQASSVHAAEQAVLACFGAPQVVVSNAGVVARAPVDAMSEEAWDHVLDVNLKGAFLVARAFLPAMKQRGTGRFIFVGSISSTLGTPGLGAYCASKWGLLGFAHSLAEELRGTGLQAMSVLPGSVDTAMLVGSGFAPAMRPSDVANLIAYAALDAPDAMNGSDLKIFGP